MSSTRKPFLLLILDGWGYREDAPDNAISQAKTPNWNRLLKECPHTLIHTHGLHVGLPAEQMGNSEVGHMNIGAGRVVYQDLTRIDAALADGSFENNPSLRNAISQAKAKQKTLHVIGLLSQGGVHSHEAHIFALLKWAASEQVQVAVHVFLDGRDTPPRSAEASLRLLLEICATHPEIRIASMGGRYYGMDRDKRWDRVEPAYRAITEADAEYYFANPIEALHAAYARGENDEFVKQCVIGERVKMQAGDVVIFMNFRADRARQLIAAFVLPNFDGFKRARDLQLNGFISLTEYAEDLPTQVAFEAQSLANALPEYLSAQGRTQLRIAETEKYAHVTFFFSGGREQTFPGESRILVPSPKVATYDLQPEMSCPEVSDKLCTAITSGEFDLIVCNLANPDMLGHTGFLSAAIKAVETVDHALGDIIAAVDATDGAMFVTADHGNLEMMLDPETGQAHTAHTMNPVWLVFRGKQKLRLAAGGALKDIAPSILAWMQLAQPTEMTGRNLITWTD